MRRYSQQNNRFQATKAQIDYLRAVHQGLKSNTNGATRGRCFKFLVFEDGKVFVKPEIVAQFKLDQEAK
jgi:hypothetical protein